MIDLKKHHVFAAVLMTIEGDNSQLLLGTQLTAGSASEALEKACTQANEEGVFSVFKKSPDFDRITECYRVVGTTGWGGVKLKRLCNDEIVDASLDVIRVA